MSDVFRLDGEIALVTGGGTGLGLAIARAMTQAGARVVIAGRREQPLREAVDSIGANVGYVAHDVTEVSRAPELVDAVAKQAGAPPTILVNNAGIHLKKPALATTEDELLKVINTHVTGSFALTRALAPNMIASKRGSIIFITSMAAIFGIPQVVAYTAAKSA